MRKFKRNSLFFVAAVLIIYLGVRAWYFRPEFASGDSFPVFEATLSDGSSFSLAQLRGSYVLIDFWGSWCGPCIREIPAHEELYRQFHTAGFQDGQGFQIVSIAVEESEERWQRALERYRQSSRYQILDKVSSLRFFNGSLTKLMSVKKLPASFLVDPTGNILGADLKAPEIRAILEERLAQ